MAAVQGKRQVDSDGKRWKQANGKARSDSATNENCCCEGGCGTCDAIADISVTFSGITLCACIETAGAGWISLTGDPNATYTGFTPATIPDHPCAFTKAITLTVDFFASGSCTSPSSSSVNWTIFVYRNTANTAWMVAILCNDYEDLAIFSGETTAGYGDSPVVITAEAIACGVYTSTAFGFTIDTVGKTGTATIDFTCEEE